MGAFETIVQVMMEMNVFHLFFPWLLMLAIVYGVLEKIEFFDEATINGVISFSVATLSMGGIFLFVPEGLFTNFAAVIAFATFAIFGFIILLAMAGVDIENELSTVEGNLAAIGALVFIIIGVIGVLLTHVDINLGGGAAGGSFFDDIVMPILVLVFLLVAISSVTPSGD